MIFIYFLYLYFLIGLAFAIWFAFFRVAQIDAAAKTTSFWFKLIILPGSILLWPFLYFKLKNVKS